MLQEKEFFRQGVCPEEDSKWERLGINVGSIILEQKNQGLNYFDVEAYFKRSRVNNQKLWPLFESLYTDILTEIEGHLGEICEYSHHIALPGFQVFTESFPDGYYHIDEQFFWPFPESQFSYERVLSITLPIELPSSGAYLQFRGSEKRVDYHLGHLYLFEGLTSHRIGSTEIQPGECRMTLQGHAIRRREGGWVIGY